MKNTTRQKLKQISVLLSLIILSNKEVKVEELNNILGNLNGTYQEFGNPEYGKYLYDEYSNLPDYLKKFLEDNSMHIIVTENNESIKKIYHDVYPERKEFNNMLGLTIGDNLLAIISGCIDYDNLSDSLYSNISEEDTKKMYLKYTMYYQIGHLIDIHLNNLSNENMFVNVLYRNEKDVFLRYQYKNLGSLMDNVFSIKPDEFFASSFACYLLQPKYFKRICPNTYDYINKIVNEKLITKEKSK